MDYLSETLTYDTIEAQYTPTSLSLEGTARYAGLLRPRLFLPFGQKKELIMLFWPIFDNCWCPVVTLVTFSSNISNNTKKTKKSKKIQKI